MRATLVVAVVAVVLVSAAPAGAQFDPGATADLGAAYGDLALSDSILENTGDRRSGSGGKPGKRKRSTKPTAAQLRTLRFAPDPAVTAANNARVAEVLLAACPPERTGCPPNHEQIIAELLPTGVLHDLFGGNVETLLGGSRRNVADAAAGFVVLIWVTQRDEPGRPATLTSAQSAGARAFLRDTREALARSRRFRRLPDAKQQRMAETLGAVAQHGISLRRAYLEAGEVAASERVATYLRDVAKDWTGLDADDLRLTRRGFVER
jgi:hypothetical protein